MTKYVKFASIAGALSLPAAASADTGAHHADILTQIIHWLSSPAHALFAVLGGLALSALIITLARKTRA